MSYKHVAGDDFRFSPVYMMHAKRHFLAAYQHQDAAAPMMMAIAAAIESAVDESGADASAMARPHIEELTSMAGGFSPRNRRSPPIAKC